MELIPIPGEFAVCQIPSVSGADFGAPFMFLSVTDEEISLVCPVSRVPEPAVRADAGWRMFRVAGTLDFSLVGILSRLSSLLAGAGIGIFAVSTFNTDYVLTKAENFARALDVLEANGYTVRKEPG